MSSASRRGRGSSLGEERTTASMVRFLSWDGAPGGVAQRPAASRARARLAAFAGGCARTSTPAPERRAGSAGGQEERETMTWVGEVARFGGRPVAARRHRAQTMTSRPAGSTMEVISADGRYRPHNSQSIGRAPGSASMSVSRLPGEPTTDASGPGHGSIQPHAPVTFPASGGQRAVNIVFAARWSADCAGGPTPGAPGPRVQPRRRAAQLALRTSSTGLLASAVRGASRNPRFGSRRRGRSHARSPPGA
jgi:hypothetical protein